MSTVPSPAKASAEAPEVCASADPAKEELDVERFSKLPIEKRTMPAEKWEEEVTGKSRRFVAFPHLGLHCRSRVGQTKEPWLWFFECSVLVFVLHANGVSEYIIHITWAQKGPSWANACNSPHRTPAQDNIVIGVPWHLRSSFFHTNSRPMSVQNTADFWKEKKVPILVCRILEN